MSTYPFQWAQLGVGFGWSDAPRKAALYGLPKPIIPEGQREDEGAVAMAAKCFNLFLGQTALFLTFAYTAPEPAHIAEFLARFGLGKRSKRSELPQSLAEIVRNVSGPDASIDDWVGCWWEMRLAVELWLMLREGDRIGLHRHVRWETGADGGRQVVYESRPDAYQNEWPRRPTMQYVIASKAERPEWLSFFKDKDVVGPARAYLQLNASEHMQGQVDSVVLFDLEKGAQQLHLVPRTFLAGLWLQFGHALGADKDNEYKRCPECGASFLVSPETARTNKLFCSNACRCRLRRRQLRARQLHQQGLPLVQIAGAVDADVKTIRKWIRQRRD